MHRRDAYKRHVGQLEPGQGRRLRLRRPVAAEPGVWRPVDPYPVFKDALINFLYEQPWFNNATGR